MSHQKPTARFCGLLLTAVLAALAATPASALSCRRSSLSSDFERADWVVLAQVTAIDLGRGDNVAHLTVRERFKGAPPPTFALSSGLGDWGVPLQPNDTWLLFLPAGHGNATRWPSMCQRHVLAAGDRYVDEDRVEATIEALRALPAGAATVAETRWATGREPRGVCWLEKAIHGPAASGEFAARSTQGNLQVIVAFDAVRHTSGPDQPASYLTIDAAGAAHRLQAPGIWTGTPDTFHAQGSAADYLLESLARAEGEVHVGLDEGSRTPLGQANLAASLRRFNACRQEPPDPGVGWLRVLTETWGGRVIRESRFRWSLAPRDDPSAAIMSGQLDGAWQETPAGDYVVTGTCGDKTSTEAVRVSAGENARVRLYCR